MFQRIIRGGAAAIVLIVAGAAAAQAQPRQMGGIGITVYENAGFRGENATFRDDEPDLNRARMANRISSFQVAPGEVWEVCEGVNYRPPCQVFSGSETNLANRSWNDRISSLRRVRGGGDFPRGGEGPGGFPRGNQPGRRGLVLYSDERFGGEARTISGFAASLGSFNDRTESIRVLSGTWEVCEDIDYGKCRVIDRDMANLDRLGLKKRVSSVRPVQGGGNRGPLDPGPGPNEVRPRLVMYDRDRYRGDARTFEGPTAALGGFGNRSQSVQVIGTWQLCDGPDFTGRCVVLTDNVPNLASYGLNNRVSSARPIIGGRGDGRRY